MVIRTMLALACVTLALPTLAADKVSDAMRKDIQHLMELTGTDNIPGQLADAVKTRTVSALQQANPDAGQQAEQIVDQVVTKHIKRAEGRQKLTQDVVAIYAENFSRQEINQLTDFYETPLGKKVVQKMPQVMQQAMSAGQQWASKRMPTVQQELRTKLAEADLLPKRSGPSPSGGMQPRSGGARPGPGGARPGPGGAQPRPGPGGASGPSPGPQ